MDLWDCLGYALLDYVLYCTYVGSGMYIDLGLQFDVLLRF